MKEFKHFRSALSEAAVFNKKMNGVPVKITKSGNKFTAYIDGDKLDTYPDQAHAMSSIKTALKELV